MIRSVSLIYGKALCGRGADFYSILSPAYAIMHVGNKSGGIGFNKIKEACARYLEMLSGRENNPLISNERIMSELMIEKLKLE